MKFFKIFLILLCMCLICGGASAAGVSASENVITVSNTTTVYNMTTLYNELVSMHGVETTESTYLRQVEPKVWETHWLRTLGAADTFYINDSDCVELRITPKYYTGWHCLQGNFQISDCIIQGWNNTTNSPHGFDKSGIVTLYKPSHNSTFNNMNHVNFGYHATSTPLDDVVLSNITLNQTAVGMYVEGDNVTIHDIVIKDGEPVHGAGLLAWSNNSYIYNVSVINASSIEYESTGVYGLQLVGDNNTVHDYYIGPWIAYSTTNLHGDNNTFYNFTCIAGQHNGAEAQCNDSYFENWTIIDAKRKGFFQVGKAEAIPPKIRGNNTYKNFTIISSGGSSFGFEEGSFNSSLENITIDGGGYGVYCSSSNNCTVSNLTVSNASNAFVTSIMTGSPFNYSDCHILKNSDLRGSSSSSEVYLPYSSNIRLINCLFNSARGDFGDTVRQSFYLDLAVKDQNDTPLSGYSEITNEVNPLRTSFDVLGNDQTNFTITGGRTAAPSVPDLSPVITDRESAYWVSFTNHEYTANISTATGNVSLDNINPSPFWYRSNPAASKYTITALINDSENLHFTGYVPTPEYNIFNSGESVKFQIWANEPLTTVVWKKDNAIVQSGASTTYETVLDAAPITVDISGETATETITKSFVIDPTQIIDPDPEPEDPEDPETIPYPPVTNFTGNTTNGTIPLRVQFNDSSTNATHWYWDFDNNGVVDSTIRNATFVYNTKGNYTVKLTTSNADGMNVSTQINYIQAQGRTGTLLYIWNWFSNIFTFLTGVAING